MNMSDIDITEKSTIEDADHTPSMPMYKGNTSTNGMKSSN